MLHEYDFRKYVNTFKARSQTSVNEYNPTCGMCFCVLCLIPIAADIVKKISLVRMYDKPLEFLMKTEIN